MNISLLRRRSAFERAAAVLMVGLASVAWAQANSQSAPVRGGCTGIDVRTLGKPSASLPFKLVHGIPVVNLTVNHRKDQRFVVDTGAPISVLNSVRAGDLGIPLLASPRGLVAHGFGSPTGVPVSETEPIPIDLDGVRERLRFAALDLSGFARALGIHLTGLVGYDVLQSVPTVIDYKQRRLLFYRRSEFRPPGGGVAALSLDDERSLDGVFRSPVIAGSLTVGGADLGRVRVKLDTGYNGTVEVLGRFARDHDLDALHGWKRTKIVGATGSGEEFRGQKGVLAAGGVRFRIKRVRMSLSTVGVGDGAYYDLVMGVPDRKTVVIVLDVPAGKLYLGRSVKATAGSSTCPE